MSKKWSVKTIVIVVGAVAAFIGLALGIWKKITSVDYLK